MKKIVIPVFPFLVVFTILVWGNYSLSRANQTITQATTFCQDGLAGTYPCQNVDLLAFMSNADLETSDTILPANLWGWTDPETGKEYVLLGMQDGTTFVDISDPTNPVLLGKLPGHNFVATKFRDIKVYQNYAYIVADTSLEPSQVTATHGIQIFDLGTLSNITTTTTFTETAYYDGFDNGHNIFVHESTGYAYITRNPICNGAVMMYDLQQPLAPTFAGCYTDGDVASDSACVVYHGPDPNYQGREICAIASDDDLVIGDVTSKTQPIHLATMSYDNVQRAHHVWFSEDHHYLLSADMDDEHHPGGDNTRIFIWDVSQLMTPTLSIYDGPTTGSDHNVWIQGGYAFVGNLRAGLRILDVQDMNNVQQAAFFDTFPANDNPGHEQGAWAVYAYFESGVVAVSNREGGLFLLRPLLNHTYLPLVR